MEAQDVAVTSPVPRVIETAEERAYRPVLRRLWRNKAATVGLVVIGVMAVVALLASLIAPYDPTAQNPLLQLQQPSLAHLMGTDEFGRDVFSRILYGTRPSLAVGFIAVGIATVAGLAVGVTAGYCGRPAPQDHRASRPAQHRRPGDRADLGELCLRHSDRGGAQLSGPGHPATRAVMGTDAELRAAVHLYRSAALPVARHRHCARGA